MFNDERNKIILGFSERKSTRNFYGSFGRHFAFSIFCRYYVCKDWFERKGCLDQMSTTSCFANSIPALLLFIQDANDLSCTCLLQKSAAFLFR